jgi:hypothetical protein
MMERLQYVGQTEYSASEIRKILQRLFPQRRLVLSQFTFFQQIGVAKPTGVTSRRGRRCYRLQDLLSIAGVLALKEEGIPLKNIECAPAMIQEKADAIFEIGSGCRLSGFGENITLRLPNDVVDPHHIESFLEVDPKDPVLFWSFDLGELAEQLVMISSQLHEEQALRAA